MISRYMKVTIVTIANSCVSNCKNNSYSMHLCLESMRARNWTTIQQLCWCLCGRLCPEFVFSRNTRFLRRNIQGLHFSVFLRRILFARSVVVDVVIDWSAALPQENVNNTTEWTDGISYCCRLLVQSPSAMTLTC